MLVSPFRQAFVPSILSMPRVNNTRAVPTSEQRDRLLTTVMYLARAYAERTVMFTSGNTTGVAGGADGYAQNLRDALAALTTRSALLQVADSWTYTNSMRPTQSSAALIANAIASVIREYAALYA